MLLAGMSNRSRGRTIAGLPRGWLLVMALSGLSSTASAQLSTFADPERPNQIAVAEAADSAVAAGQASADLAAVRATLLAGDTAAARTGLQQMSGEIRAGTIASLALKDGLFLGRILGQMHRLHTDPSGEQPEAPTEPGGPASAPSSHLYQWLNGSTERPKIGPWYLQGDHQFWAFASGYSGEVDSTAENDGVEYNGSGGVVGYTYRWSDRVRTGLHLGFTTTEIESLAGGDTNEVESLNTGIQLAFSDNGNYIEGVAGVASNDFVSSRVLQFSGIDRVAAAEYTGRQSYIYVEVGQTYELGKESELEQWHVEPQLAMQSTTYSTDAYVETGATGLNLAALENDLSFFQTALGARFFYTNLTGSDEWIIPDLVIRWGHEFGDIERTLSSTFEGTTPVFTTAARPADRDTLQLRLGVTTHTRENWTFDFSYNADLSDGYLGQAGTARGVWRF